MDVNSTAGTIFVSSTKLPGTYTIKVKGILPDLVSSTSEIFTILIKEKNMPPIYLSTR